MKWQCLYPGLELGEGSTTAAEWSERIGTDFHEAMITTEAQSISLVFSDLEVTQAIPGETPFTVTDDGPYFKIPRP